MEKMKQNISVLFVIYHHIILIQNLNGRNVNKNYVHV